MDSIRPEDDELRADTPIGGETRKGAQRRTRERQRPGNGGSQTSPPADSESTAGRSSGGMVRLLLLLLVVGIGGGGWFGWQMHRQIKAMESQLEEADYWARQSKLALARFEGELSETGENLEEKGTSLDQRLGNLDTQVDKANDEIRKLWVLSNEKNRPKIASLAEQQQSLDGELGTLSDKVETLSGQLDSTGEQVATLKESNETLSTKLGQTSEALETSREQWKDVSGELDSVKDRLSGVDEQVAQKLRRFEQEQSLTLDGLESRIQAMESGGGRLEELSKQLSATRGRLQEAERTLESVDASRSQLTSRLVRLQNQVDQLRAR